MICRIIFVALICWLNITLVNAQTKQIIPIYDSKELTNNTLNIKSDSGSLVITAFRPNLIKFTFRNNSDFLPEENSEKLNIRVTQNLDDIFFATDSLWVIVNKFDLAIRFLKKTNEQLLVENLSYFLGNKDRSLSFSLNADDNLSVFDAGKATTLVEVGKTSKAFTGTKKLCNSLLVSSKGYAVLIQNSTAKKIKASLAANREIKFKTKGTALKSFYFLSGRTAEIEDGLALIKDPKP